MGAGGKQTLSFDTSRTFSTRQGGLSPGDALTILPGVTHRSGSSRDVKCRMWKLKYQNSEIPTFRMWKLKYPKALRIQGSKNWVSSAGSSVFSALSSYQMLPSTCKEISTKISFRSTTTENQRCEAKPPHLPVFLGENRFYYRLWTP